MPNHSGSRVREIAACTGVSSLLLEHHCRLASIDAQDLSRLAAASECQLVPAGRVIYRQGETADSVYLILSGNVTLERRDGSHSVVARRHAVLHSTFGDAVLIGEGERRHTARVDDAVVLVKMPPGLLRQVLTAYPNVAADWTFDILTRHVRAIRRRRPRFFRYFGDTISAA